MKKMKTLFLSLALMLAAGATATGCDTFDKWFGKESSNQSSIEEGFVDSTEVLVSVAFEKAEVSVYQYEEISLVCTAKGTDETIVYTSEDDTVATVDANGKVTAKDKVGSVKITATAGGVSATCTVRVEKSPYHPHIVLNSTNYTIETGDTLEFNVATEWNKKLLSEGVNYAISFAENSQNAKAEISVEGDMVKIVADTVESFDVILSATARGLYTSQQFTVNVVAPKLKLLPTDVVFTPTDGKYVTSVSSTDLVGDMVNSRPLNFVAVKGGEKLENVSVDWTVIGDAAVVEDGNLVGKRVGVATLLGVVEYEGEEATVTLECTVIPPELTLDETIVIELQSANPSHTFHSSFIGTLESAEFDGVVVSSRARGQTIAFSTSKFPQVGSKLGKQELIINTSLVRYTVPVEVYTMIINDADELDQMRLVANTGEEEYSIRFSNEQGVDVYRNSQYFDGYFILGNDIAYDRAITSMTDTGSVWGVQGMEADDRGFRGIFDGCGYNIDGVTVGKHPSGDNKQAGGIFGYLATGGIVKNVSFTNAVLQANNGFICARGNGTVENVSVSYKKIGGDKATGSINSATVRTMGTFFSFAAGKNAVVKNCLVDASAAEITLETGTYQGAETMNINLVGKASNLNVIALCPDTRVLEASGADIQRYTYNDLVAESELMESFDKSYWTTVNGVPMFKNQAENLDCDTPVSFINMKPTLVAGFTMLVVANNPYTKIEVQPVEGVTFENSQLFATEEAFTKTVTLKVTSLFNAENTATITVYIDSFGTKVEAPSTETATVYYDNPVLTIGDNSWMGEQNYVYVGGDVYSVGDGEQAITLDWKALGWGKQAVTVVSVKNGVRTHFETNVNVTYRSEGKLENSVKIADSAFSDYRGVEYILTDVQSDIQAPKGYENVQRLDGDKDWSTALERHFFSKADLSAYKEIWFAMKIVNGGWVMRANNQTLNGWISFHYIQVEDGVWIAEIYEEGKCFITEYDVKGNNAQYLTYRDGWGNGFLLYNNQGRRPAGEPTSIYATEIRGILK